MAVAAIFDVDGTLVTFSLDIRQWRKALLELMKRDGFDTAGMDEATPTQEILEAGEAQAGPDRPERYGRLRTEAFAILDRLELEGVASATVFPDAVEVLGQLRAKGVRLCVVTNSGRAAVFQSLRKSDLASYFEFVLTRDDTETMKPRPEGILKAMEMLGVRPGDTYYVGDSRYDMAAARQARASPVGVATGNHTAERLKSEGAAYVIGTLSELPGILGVQAPGGTQNP